MPIDYGQYQPTISSPPSAIEAIDPGLMRLRCGDDYVDIVAPLWGNTLDLSPLRKYNVTSQGYINVGHTTKSFDFGIVKHSLVSPANTNDQLEAFETFVQNNKGQPIKMLFERGDIFEGFLDVSYQITDVREFKCDGEAVDSHNIEIRFVECL